MSALRFRAEVLPADVTRVGELVASSNFFSESERHIAEELVVANLEKGLESGYYFTFLEREDRVVGYACFGPVPATESSWDLYWIVVHDALRGEKLGRRLLEATEERVRSAGGTRLYADTAGRSQYAPTHRFYEACGYTRAAVLEDYYAPGDAKVTYLKVLAPRR